MLHADMIPTSTFITGKFYLFHFLKPWEYFILVQVSDSSEETETNSWPKNIRHHFLLLVRKTIPCHWKLVPGISLQA